MFIVSSAVVYGPTMNWLHRRYGSLPTVSYVTVGAALFVIPLVLTINPREPVQILFVFSEGARPFAVSYIVAGAVYGYEFSRVIHAGHATVMGYPDDSRRGAELAANLSDQDPEAMSEQRPRLPSQALGRALVMLTALLGLPLWVLAIVHGVQRGLLFANPQLRGTDHRSLAELHALL